MSAFDEVRARFALLAEYEGAGDRILLDLHGVRVTIDGPETPEARSAAVDLRRSIAHAMTGPGLVTPHPTRRERRRAAALNRRTA